MYGREEKFIQNIWRENLKERNYLEETHVE
jgi:hypothetical protein